MGDDADDDNDELKSQKQKIHLPLSHDADDDNADDDNADDDNSDDDSDDDSEELVEEPKNFFCDICNEGFSHVFKLRHHKRESHSRASTATSSSHTLPGNRRRNFQEEDDDDEDNISNIRVRRSTRSVRDLKLRNRTNVKQKSDDEDEDEIDELKRGVVRKSFSSMKKI